MKEVPGPSLRFGVGFGTLTEVWGGPQDLPAVGVPSQHPVCPGAVPGAGWGTPGAHLGRTWGTPGAQQNLSQVMLPIPARRSENIHGSLHVPSAVRRQTPPCGQPKKKKKKKSF